MPGGISGNVQWNNSGAFAGIAGSAATTLGELLLATPARTAPSLNYYFAVQTPADLALTADTESIGIQLGGGANAATVTRQWTAGGGSFTTQREIVAVAPTYGATAAETISQAATVAITNQPQAGANMTLTNAYALWVQAGQSRFDGTFLNSAAARATPGVVVPYFNIRTPADTGLLSGTENPGVVIGGNSTFATVSRQFAPGALTTQRENLIVAPTYAFVTASTITTAATLAINAAPIAGTNATITNSYALFVQAGMTRLQGAVRLQPGSGATGFMTATGLYFTDVTQRNNTGTTETVLSTVTLEPNFFGAVGDVLMARFDGVVQGASGGSNFFRVYFGGTASGTGGTKIFESTVTNTGIGFTVYIWRWGVANTVLWSWDAIYDSAAAHNRGTIGSLDFTGNLVLESRGISTVDGSNEVTNNATAVYKGITP